MPMRNRVRFAAARALGATAAVLVMGGCATKGDIRDLHTELRGLEVRQDSVMAELRRETLMTRDTLRGQSSELFDFRGSISQEIQQISQSLSRIEAMVGQNQQGLAGIRDQLVNLRRGPAPTTGVPADTGDVSSPAVSSQPAPSGGDAQSLFNTAVSLFNKGNLATADQAFRSLLQSSPNSPLAPDAQYYVADILEKNNKKSDALAAFQKIPQLFPTADKVPDAEYRAARLQVDLGKKSDARATLQRLIATFPGDPIAANARQLLKQIGGQMPTTF
jgi:tol-pal system protein YbgF